MKILHCITGLGVGGAESMLYNYLAYEYKTKTSDEHIVVYFYHGPLADAIQALGITTYHLKGLICPYDPFFYFRLKLLIKKINPDIIHAALWSATIFCRIIGAPLKIPVICDLHGDVTHHGPLRNYLEKITAHLPTLFIAVSSSVKSSFDTTILHNKNPKRVMVIENGIDTASFKKNLIPASTIRTHWGYKPQDFIIGTVGRQVAIKNHALLIQAFALFIKNFNQQTQVNLKLCLIGDGPEQTTLKQLASTLNITSHVQFLGTQTHAQTMYLLFDVFVLSSKSEGLSIALLEALAAQIPVISTAPELGHDLLTDMVNGLTLPYHTSPQELAHRMLKLYKNPEQRKQLKEGINDLLPRIAIKETADAYKRVYANLLNPKL